MPTMKTSLISDVSLLLLLTSSILAVAQTAPLQQSPDQQPVSYASVTRLNDILNQVEQTAQSAQVDLARLRIDKWKTDSNSKRQAQSNIEALSRNLKTALPEVITQLRNSPEDLKATFKLYRNLDALYDVFGSVAELAGAFGSKDEFQALSNDLNAIERSRRSLGERLENLTASKEAELAQLRTQVKTLQAAPPQPPKKIVVDDNEPPKKPAARKKPVPKPPKPTPPAQQAPAQPTSPQQ